MTRQLNPEPQPIGGIPQSHTQEMANRPGHPGWDAVLLGILVVAQLRIDSLAEAAVLPFLRQDVLRHPLLGRLLPAAGMEAMGERGPWPNDPVGLLLIAITLGLLIAYLLVDMTTNQGWRTRVKWILLAGIILTSVYLPSTKLMLLRHQSGPASYTHDGGVIQTEATIQFLLQGKNPYREDYTETPMAEWGFDEYRTALYHYPYLPWTFVFSAPFYLLGQAAGFYDQRVVYLLLMAIALALAPKLVRGEQHKFALVALLGLNPIMGLDLIFGQNDSFVLAWIIFSLVAWSTWQRRSARGINSPWILTLSTVLFGLACASKPTAWFFAPFYGLLLLADDSSFSQSGWTGIVKAVPTILKRVAPGLAVFAILLVPYIAWDPGAFYDDVWRWSAGQGATGYQIWGWGASNFVLALGLVSSRFAQWPFWLLEVVLTLPVLLWFVRRQQQHNQVGQACWHYGLMLLVFFYASRFLNENYLGYILAFLAIGFLSATSLPGQDVSPE
jgi:hypothetical protein